MEKIQSKQTVENLGRRLSIAPANVKKVSVIMVITLIGFYSYAQSGESMVFSGTVIDANTKIPLQGVHLVSSRNLGTTTDIDGNFHMAAYKGDTVNISHIGYHEFLVPILITQLQIPRLTIGLTPSVTELEEVIVYQWPATIAQFKQRILETEVEQEDKVTIPGSYQGPPKPVKPGVGSPISFIQSKLSKKIKRRNEFLKKRADLESHKAARARYSVDYVQEITGIKDEEELEAFMEYCKFTDLFLAEVSDYDLIVAINQCYKDFRSGRSD